MIRSAAAVVVTDTAVVDVPDVTFVDEFEVSNEATPEYSQTVSTMSSETDGEAVIVVSVPLANLYQV